VLSTSENGAPISDLVSDSNSDTFAGSICPLKLSLPHTRRPPAPLVLLPFVLVVVEKVPTAHPVVIVKDTARRRRAPPASSGHNSLVLDGVLLGSKRWVRVHYIILYDNEKLFGMSMSLCTHAMPFSLCRIFFLVSHPVIPPIYFDDRLEGYIQKCPQGFSDEADRFPHL